MTLLTVSKCALLLDVSPALHETPSPTHPPKLRSSPLAGRHGNSPFPPQGQAIHSGPTRVESLRSVFQGLFFCFIFFSGTFLTRNI